MRDHFAGCRLRCHVCATAWLASWLTRKSMQAAGAVLRCLTIWCRAYLFCVLADTVFTSMFIVWVTGHVTEILPDLPYTTNPYNINPLNESAPGASCTFRDLRHFSGPYPARLSSVKYRWWPSGHDGRLSIVSSHLL